MFNVQQIERVFVANAAALTTTASADLLNTGEIGMFSPAGVRILGAGIAAATEFVLVQKLADGSLLTTDTIRRRDITFMGQSLGSAKLEQTEYIGYNGTSGDIEAISDNTYILSFFYEELYTATKDNKYVKHARATTGATASKHDVAEQLVKDAIRNVGIKSKEPQALLKAELVINNAGAVVATGADNFVFTHGSKYFTATDIDNATGGDALIVGTFLRIGTAVTDPVYRITAIDTVGNIGTFDVPYQGATTTIADTGLEQISAANYLLSTIGVKLTGLEIPFKYNRVGRTRYDKNVWTTTLSNFGTTTFTQSQGPTDGNGITPMVAEREYFHAFPEYGDNHYQIDNGRPILFDSRQLVNSAIPYYHTITIRYNHNSGGMFRNDISEKQVTIFTSGGAAAANDPAFMSTATNGLRVLISTIAAALGYPAMSNPA